MQAELPWPVSPEFRDALADATERHQAILQSNLVPSPRQLPHSVCSTPRQDFLHSPEQPIMRSPSLMMKTRVAVRDKTPHRFQVVPLREAPKNLVHDRQDDRIKQSGASWTRPVTANAVRPSGIGLGLKMVRQSGSRETRPSDSLQPQRPPTTIVSEHSCDVPPRSEVVGSSVAQRDLTQLLEVPAPSRRPSDYPGRKENRPAVDCKLPGSLSKRRSERVLKDNTSTPLKSRTAGANASLVSVSPAVLCTSSTLDTPTRSSRTPTKALPSVQSRHFKSPSLGAILLSSETPKTNDETPKVRCRKRTNTLSIAHSATKRYGVYTADQINLNPEAPRVTSTYSLSAILAAYSSDSIPSVYSQDSFVTERSTRPLRVAARRNESQRLTGPAEAHPIVRALVRDIETAIGDWL